MSMADKIRKAVRTFLKIEPAGKKSFTIQEDLDFYGNAFANKL